MLVLLNYIILIIIKLFELKDEPDKLYYINISKSS